MVARAIRRFFVVRTERTLVRAARFPSTYRSMYPRAESQRLGVRRTLSLTSNEMGLPTVVWEDDDIEMLRRGADGR